MTDDDDSLLRAIASSPSVAPPVLLTTVLAVRGSTADLARAPELLARQAVETAGEDIVIRLVDTGGDSAPLKAAALARRLRDSSKAIRIALATGRATADGDEPLRARALALLDSCSADRPIRVDETTAGLIEGRFDDLVAPMRTAAPPTERTIENAIEDERRLNAGRIFVLTAVASGAFAINSLVLALTSALEQGISAITSSAWFVFALARVLLGRSRPQTKSKLLYTILLIDVPLQFVMQYLLLQGHRNPVSVATFTLNMAMIVAAFNQFFLSPRMIVASGLGLIAATSWFFWMSGEGFLSSIGILEVAAVSSLGIYAQNRTRALLRRAHDEASARVHEVEEANRRVSALNVELRRQVADRSRELSDALSRLAAAPLGLVRLAPGDVLAERYRIVRPLGSGGMGEVHEVERLADQRRLALKVLKGAVDPIALARFAREAQVAAQLDHPNVVAAHDVGVTPNGTMYVVMELVGGSSLAEQRIHFGDAIWALPILDQIATALAAMHAHGIIHRDLKPSNILVDGDVVKIADFGLASMDNAALLDTREIDASELPLTQSHVIIGTPLYMAPELASGARNAGPSTDVFSLGVVAFELLAKRLPHVVPPVLQRANGSEVAPAIPLRELRSDLPAELLDLVDRCLSTSASSRPTTRELAAAFTRLGVSRDGSRARGDRLA